MAAEQNSRPLRGAAAILTELCRLGRFIIHLGDLTHCSWKHTPSGASARALTQTRAELLFLTVCSPLV